MGSPGGYQLRLEGHCVHKLPTSCVLTSTRKCCACEDLRSHSSTYTVYVDGAGLRPWGTRWINYCWPCKEYWDHRTGNGVLPTSVTRVPEIPDQSRFLERWDEFYDQYWALVQQQRQHEQQGASDLSGSTHLQTILSSSLDGQEPWRDVDPGRLPRTRREILAGFGRSQYEMAIDAEQQHELLNARQQQSVQAVGIDEALDQLMDVDSDDGDQSMGDQREEPNEDASREERTFVANEQSLETPQAALSTNEAQTQTPFQGYSEMASRRLQQWPRQLLSILSDPYENTPPSSLPPQRGTNTALTLLSSPGNNASQGELSMPSRMAIAHDPLHDQPEHNESVVEHTLSRGEATTGNIATGAGQAPDEELTDTYSSSWQDLALATIETIRYSLPSASDPEFALAVRRLIVCVQHYMSLSREDLVATTGDTSSSNARLGIVQTLLDNLRAAYDLAQQQRNQQGRLEAMLGDIQRHLSLLHVSETNVQQNIDATQSPNAHWYRVPATIPSHTFTYGQFGKLGLDSLPRPDALNDEQMLLRIECGICMQQIANVACVPCGHVVMCPWCADIHMPLMPGAASAIHYPNTPCPKCREPVKQRIKLYY